MNKYEHGNWYCKPANEAEAREIIERAVASGAELFESVGEGTDKYRWDLREYWGVMSGYTENSNNSIFSCKTIYTIEQVREKFPLPSELQVNIGPHFEHEQKEVVRSDVNVSVGSKPAQWDGKGLLPPIGVDVEVFHEGRWIGAATVGEFGYHKKCMVCAPSGGGFYGFYADDIRPIRSERERWVQAASNGLSGDMDMLKYSEFIIGQLYDALKSGNLKAPEVE